MRIDSTDNTGLAVGASDASSVTSSLWRDSLTGQMNGQIMEAEILNAGFSLTNRSDLNSNQHGTNGYNF